MLVVRKILLSVVILMGSTNAFALAMDTINRTDENNMKQGHWVFTNKTKKLPGYSDNQVVEEGDFHDDRKSGKWIFYFNNDKVKHILTYTNNRPNGYAVFYYSNGNKREEGTWKNDRWIGDYKYYYENGNVRNDWKYSVNGRRTGVQKYYHENGQLMIEGNWENGQEAGTIIEYFEDGSVKSERVFNNGKIDQVATKNYQPKEKPGKPSVEKEVKPYVAKESAEKERVITKKEEEVKEATPWSGTGTKSFLNKDGDIVRQGYFENGYLMDGEVFMYTADRKKFRTTYYKEGRVVKIVNHQDSTASN